MNKRYGKIKKGDTIPYGTFVGASEELRQAYYYYGYKDDLTLPELPCFPHKYRECVDPEEELYNKEIVTVVADVLNTLNRKTRKVLRLRFGIELNCDYTLEEIGRAFDLTKERIRQIEAKGLRLLKHPHRADTLMEIYKEKT